MRMACVAGAVLSLVSVLPSFAQDQAPNPLKPVSDVLQAITNNPDGWTRNMDGSYKQAESGVLCPMQFKSFNLQSVSGPDAASANILGNCHYADGNGRSGSIRVRKYVEGWGSDITIAANDKTLMATDGSAPPMLMRASTDRKSGASRLTVTTDRRGFLIDCSVAQIEHSIPRGDFPLYCTTIP
jgi:hypothetical protein